MRLGGAPYKKQANRCEFRVLSKFMGLRAAIFFLVFLAAAGFKTTSHALDQSIPRVHGDQSRLTLGDGTGIVIGIIDSGIDALHPALAVLDSLGQPRLVAAQNFVRTESELSADDVFGHGTAVAGVALSSDAL